MDRALEWEDVAPTPALAVACALDVVVEVVAVVEGRSDDVMGGATDFEACEDGVCEDVDAARRECALPDTCWLPRRCAPSRSRSRSLSLRPLSRCGAVVAEGDLGASFDWLLPILPHTQSGPPLSYTRKLGKAHIVGRTR